MSYHHDSQYETLEATSFEAVAQSNIPLNLLLLVRFERPAQTSKYRTIAATTRCAMLHKETIIPGKPHGLDNRMLMLWLSNGN